MSFVSHERQKNVKRTSYLRSERSKDVSKKILCGCSQNTILKADFLSSIKNQNISTKEKKDESRLHESS